MQKRKYIRIKAVEAEILQLHLEGKTHRKIAEVYGLEREQAKKFLKRHGSSTSRIPRVIPVFRRLYFLVHIVTSHQTVVHPVTGR